ncbi:MAG TPA: nucleotidyltransferase domain-containing protein [Limnochordia bacterium]
MGYRLRPSPERSRQLHDHLAAVVRALAGTDVQKAIVFGSFARGDVGRASDIDLVLIRETGQPFLRRADDLYARLPAGVAMDLLVYTPQEWEQLDTPFLRRVRREGRVVYEA